MYVPDVYVCIMHFAALLMYVCIITIYDRTSKYDTLLVRRFRMLAFSFSF